MTYAPMYVRDRERINNLNYIYNNGDVEVVNMLRMKKIVFNQLVNTLRGRGCLGTASTPVSKSNLLCSFMSSGRTNDSESSKAHAGDRLRPFLGTLRK
jgi:hypothetical protein